MNCLQDNMKELSQECRWAVGNFTQDVDEDPQLDRILMKSCAKPIKEFCQVGYMARMGDVMWVAIAGTTLLVPCQQGSTLTLYMLNFSEGT